MSAKDEVLEWVFNANEALKKEYNAMSDDEYIGSSTEELMVYLTQMLFSDFPLNDVRTNYYLTSLEDDSRIKLDKTAFEKLGYKFIEGEIAFESYLDSYGNAETADCYGVIQLGEKFYKAEWWYRSYNGMEWDALVPSITEVKPVQKCYTVFENVFENV